MKSIKNRWSRSTLQICDTKTLQGKLFIKKEKSGVCIQWNIIQPQKEGNNAIFSNMDGPGDYHTKWRKLEKRWICDFMWNLKKRIQMNLFMK